MYDEAAPVRSSSALSHHYPRYNNSIIYNHLLFIVCHLLLVCHGQVYANNFPAEELGKTDKILWEQVLPLKQRHLARGQKIPDDKREHFEAGPLPADRDTYASPAADIIDAIGEVPDMLNSATLSGIAALHTTDLEPSMKVDADRETVRSTNITECTVSSPAVAGDSRLIADCTALLNSKNTLNPSGSQLNWSVGLPMTDWQGIQVTEGRVTQLSLSNIDLAGSIPAEIGNLASLERLHLNGNGLTGVIPEELGNLTNLKKLYLNSN